jgi:hypothetical protein
VPRAAGSTEESLGLEPDFTRLQASSAILGWEASEPLPYKPFSLTAAAAPPQPLGVGDHLFLVVWGEDSWEEWGN